MIPSSVFIYVLIPVILFIALLFPDSDMTTDSGEFSLPSLPLRLRLLSKRGEGHYICDSKLGLFPQRRGLVERIYIK